MRVIAYVDGFNLYHAIDDLSSQAAGASSSGEHPALKASDVSLARVERATAYRASHKHHLKWVNLRALCQTYVPGGDFDLVEVKYFTAFATWRTDACKRHRQFVLAQQAVGVTPIMGRFKPKDRSCLRCHTAWQDHEEKETDVNIALHLIDDAYQDCYDMALLMTGDSDLVPAVKLVRRRFPAKRIRIITPVGRETSGELRSAVGGGKKPATKMTEFHLERCLLPATVQNVAGEAIAVRPMKYTPPVRS